MPENRYYFDWAATAVPELLPPETKIPYGNPSSGHREGRDAKEALESCRRRCAAVLGVPPETLYFTSGGTESNCIPLYSYAVRQGSGRILASAGEHSSVTENMKTLERLGKAIGSIPIDSAGCVTPEIVSKTLEKYPDTRFAAIMAVNNETGTINDIARLRQVLRSGNGHPVHFHCDLVQAAGKIPLDISGWELDSASISAHKIGGQRGIGLLYLRTPLEALYAGGGQERNVRPGTENVAGALAFAACLENHATPEKLKSDIGAATRRCNHLLESLSKIKCSQGLHRCRIIPAERKVNDASFSPYIVQAGFRGIPGEVMVRALDDIGFAVSTGSACSSASHGRPVLSAMGINNSLGLEGIRISQGWSTTDGEIDLLLGAIAKVLRFL